MSTNEKVKNSLFEMVEGLQQNLVDMEKIIESIYQLSEELVERTKNIHERTMHFLENIEKSPNDQAGLLDAAKSLKESYLSFDVQRETLMNQMQNENRSYTAVSNIMKTKHDTVKNSISNIR